VKEHVEVEEIVKNDEPEFMKYIRNMNMKFDHKEYIKDHFGDDKLDNGVRKHVIIDNECEEEEGKQEDEPPQQEWTNSLISPELMASLMKNVQQQNIQQEPPT
jgi:hypothetical protein